MGRTSTTENVLADINAFGAGELTSDSKESLDAGRRVGYVHVTYTPAGRAATAKEERRYQLQGKTGFNRALNSGLVKYRGTRLFLSNEGKAKFKRILEEAGPSSRLNPGWRMENAKFKRILDEAGPSSRPGQRMGNV